MLQKTSIKYGNIWNSLHSVERIALMGKDFNARFNGWYYMTNEERDCVKNKMRNKIRVLNEEHIRKCITKNQEAQNVTPIK